MSESINQLINQPFTGYLLPTAFSAISWVRPSALYWLPASYRVKSAVSWVLTSSAYWLPACLVPRFNAISWVLPPSRALVVERS